MGVEWQPNASMILDHADRGPKLIGVSWALFGLASVFLGLRLFCKFHARRRLWWDDWILMGAWIMIVINNVLTTILVREFGLGRHGWNMMVNPSNLTRFKLIMDSRGSVTLTAISLTKLAFAARLLQLTQGRIYYFVWFVIITTNITMGFSAVVPWIQCNPIAKTWRPGIPGSCWANGVGTTIWIALGAYSALMDFTLAALPWTFLWGLRIRKKEKIGVAVAMSMGIIAGTVAVVKCIKLPTLNHNDFYRSTELFIWDVTESTVTMVAACIPSLRILIQDVTKGSNQLPTNELLDVTAELAQIATKKIEVSSEVAECASSC